MQVRRGDDHPLTTHMLQRTKPVVLRRLGLLMRHIWVLTSSCINERMHEQCRTQHQNPILYVDGAAARKEAYMRKHHCHI